jgi:hypothetical protein
MSHCYQIFGLTLDSDMALPRLALGSAAHGQVDVRIKLAPVAKEGLPSPTMSYPRVQLAPQSVWFSIDAVGRFLVTNGERILVDPNEGADMQTVCLYVLGSCLGAIVHQRKQLILHGNAIKVGEGAVIFTGPSGIGKSTTAAGFHKRGYPILADDLSVIDQSNRVLPSYPQIKLWADTIKQLNYDSTEFERIRLEVDKFEMPIGDQFHPEPVKVTTVYVLHKHAQSDFLFQEVTGVGKLAPLQNQTYRKLYVKGMGLSKSHAENCVRLAREVRVVHITRPESGFELDRLIDLTIEDLKG